LPSSERASTLLAVCASDSNANLQLRPADIHYHTSASDNKTLKNAQSMQQLSREEFWEFCGLDEF
jgi:hypothetical protein